MEGRGNLVAAIIVIVLVLAVVLGTILYLTKSLGGKFSLFNNFPKFTTTKITTTPMPKVSLFPITSSTTQPSKAPSKTPLPTNNNSGTALPVPNSDKNIYYGKGFQLKYPSKWGFLSCSNSQNFEFDSYNSSNKKIVCDSAVKPITVLIDQGVSCKGDLIKLGSHQVYKSKVQYRDWLTNEYCLNEVGRNIDITNRVASSGAIGTGKEDYSSQIEQIISTISFQ